MTEKSRTEKIVELREKGRTYEEIASELETSKSVVYRHLKSYGDKDLRREGNNVKKLSDTEAAYLAGLIDGEGCITLSMQDNSKGEHIAPVVKVNMASESVIDEMCRLTGLNKKRKKNTCNDRKTQWVFKIHAHKEIIQFLEQIQEFLIEKDYESKLMLEFCRNRKTNRSYTEREYDILEDIKEAKK